MNYRDLFSLVLPIGILDHFDILDSTISENKVDIYLVEKHIIPYGYSSDDVISHGYHKESIVQDFPFRDKSMYLHVKRRRWLVKKTQQVISRDLTLAASGTHISCEFATFLKGIYR